jgi:hypothetical protein
MSIERSIERTGQVFQDDEHFRVEVVRWPKKNGTVKTAVLKTMQDATSERRQDGFHNEAVGTETFRRLARSHPEWGLVVPRTYASEKTWAVRRLMSGGPILHQGTEYQDVDRTKMLLAKLARVLAMIDSIEPDISADDDPRNSAPYDNMLARVPAWAADPLRDGLLSPNDLAAATDLIGINQQLYMPRYAHGDLMPYAHVFARTDERLAFIDFEHFSARKPRYYDAAYCYAQMAVKMPDPELAGYFIDEFFGAADPAKHQTEQFMPVLAQRAIRMFFDASFEDIPLKSQRVQKVRQLLDLSLGGNLEALTQPPSPLVRDMIVSSEDTDLQFA